MPKGLLVLKWGKHLLFQIVQFCRGRASDSRQESLGCVVPVPCAGRDWLGTQVLCTLDDHRASSCLWKVGCVPGGWLGKHS